MDDSFPTNSIPTDARFMMGMIRTCRAWISGMV